VTPSTGGRRVLLITNLSESLLTARGDLIAAMLARGVEVHCTGPALVGEVAATLSAMGCTCHDLHLSRTGVSPRDDLRYLRALRRLMARHRFDVVMGYNIKPVVFGMAAARMVGVPVRVALITGLGFSFIPQPGARMALLRALSRGMFRYGMHCATRVVFQNDDDERLITELFRIPPAKVGRVDGSGVSLERFRHVPATAREAPVFLMIARLLVSKGVNEYVAAARLVKQAFPEVRFQLIGWHDDNPAAVDAGELQRAVDDGVIEFLGRVKDVTPALQACSVFVLPSYREGTPRCVLEALAVGRAVITTDAPGCRQTVVDGVNGFLVPVKAVRELADAMTRFVAEPGLIESMGLAARARAEVKYDVRKINAVMLREMSIPDGAGRADA
jgi:glycosyltransferase involved in cell wall biosynthesis